MKSAGQLNKQLRALIYHQGIDSEMSQKEGMEILQNDISKSCYSYLLIGIFVGAFIATSIIFYNL